MVCNLMFTKKNKFAFNTNKSICYRDNEFVFLFCVFILCKSNIEVLSENIYTSLEKAIFKNELQG